MSTTAAERACAIPELVAFILDHLRDDKRSLSSAIRVSSTWYEAGVPVLWHAPSRRALIHVSKERRQMHANYMQELDITYADRDLTQEDHDAHHMRCALEFPRLRRILLDEELAVDGTSMLQQYFQPRLQEFAILRVETPQSLLWLLSERCPDLRALKIDSVAADVSGKTFVEFLDRFRKLDSMSLRYGKAWASDDFFCYLAGRQPLKALRLESTVQSHTIRRAAKTTGTLFAELAELDIRIEDHDLTELLTMVKCVESLSLRLERTTELQILPRLSRLQNLERLRVSTYIAGPHIAGGPIREDFLCLKLFTKLRHLDLPRSIGLSDLDRSSWCGIFACLPELRTVNLFVEMVDSAQLLIAIGQNCRHLVMCSLGGTFALEQLDEVLAPLFPSLAALRLDPAKIHIPQTAQQREKLAYRIASLIHTHAPKLGDFQLHRSAFRDGDKHFAGNTMQRWRELVERPAMMLDGESWRT